MSLKTGLDNLLLDPKQTDSWGNFGLLCNQASVTENLDSAWDVVSNQFGSRLVSLFGPQHGFAGTEQYNMRESTHSKHLATGLPVYSLYSETRKPTEEMFSGLDTLVIDLQISGCRIYTWKATIQGCLQAAKQYGKKIVILDRPNPLGGEVVEGRTCDKDMMSFVGVIESPMRHGLTTAELALLMNVEIGAELETIELNGWDPSKYWHELGRPWVLTSPMLPTDTSTYVYPGTVLFEGTNFSEGRGTTLPFQFIGAPYIKNPRQIIERLQGKEYCKGLHLTESSFIPTFDKGVGEQCNGIHIHVLDPAKVRSYYFAIEVIAAFKALGGDAFSWTAPGYEYDYDNLPINLLIGSAHAADKISSGPEHNDPFWREGISDYIEKANKILLYERNLRDET